MFSKILIAAILGSSMMGGGVATGFAPTGFELAAGPIRFESGNGKEVGAYLAPHAPFTLTINLKDERRLQIKF